MITSMTEVKKDAPPQQQMYRTGPGSYNRESGDKTLRFVAVLITIIVILVVLTLFLVNRRSSVMVQGISTQNEQTVTH